MYIFEPILRKNWENTEKMDAIRIASQTEPEGFEKILDFESLSCITDQPS